MKEGVLKQRGQADVTAKTGALAAKKSPQEAAELAQAIQRLRAQRFELIDAVCEQLGKLCLGAMHTEAPLQQLQFFR